MRTLLLVAVLTAYAAGCQAGPDPGQQPDAQVPPPCSLDQEIEAVPGFPFDPKVFRDQVWPVLAEACATQGCHLGPDGAAGFDIWPVSEDACAFAYSFNAVYANSDFRLAPLTSAVYTAASGTMPGHPALPAPDLQVLQDYLVAAHTVYTEASTGIDDSAYFDIAIYRDSIQPTLDETGCLAAACHAPGSAAGGFALSPGPEPDSMDMEANFRALVDLVVSDARPTPTSELIEDGTRSRLFVRAADNHGGVRMVAGDLAVLLQWIEAGLAALPRPEPGCAAASAFEVDIFADEIMPVLNGDVDLNDPNSGRNTIGCTRTPCHGMDRGPGTLYLDEQGTAEDNLRRFACFVDLGNPSASQIVACPLGSTRCLVAPHPGDDIFSGPKDRNYQRIVSYLYAANAEATPLDFAFFVRKINPIFDDPAAVMAGELGLTCADRQCHGISSPDQEPPNGSNFGLLPEAGSSPEELLLNFAEAAGFAHFHDPAQSSLILYPTNGIADPSNALATGLPHPGGADFAVDSPQAQAIIQWAGGLRPDEQGFQRFWLVAGDFPASNVADEKIADEAALAPRIFDVSGQPMQFHRGQWNAFVSDTAFIDLADPEQGFFREQPAGRMVYAVAYVINTSSRNIETEITVRSANDVELHVGTAQSVSRNGVGTTVVATLPSYARSRQLTRIMVKVFQAEGQSSVGFDLQLSTNGRPLTSRSRELVIKLGPEGGI